ncbi:MAG: hypothetical protein QXK37_02315 [Candidatus Woesearchaeota archaeon]
MQNNEKQNLNCRVIIEMLGAPKEHIEETIRMYVNKLKEDYKAIKVLREYYAEPEKKDKLFATFVELDLEVKGVENLVWFCFDYMPSSVEIFEPEEIVYKTRDFTNFINDLQAKLHKVDNVIKNLSAENQVLKKNSTIIIRNLVKLSVKEGGKKAEEIAKLAGLSEDAVEKVLAAMINDKIIVKKGNFYSLSSNTQPA